MAHPHTDTAPLSPSKEMSSFLIQVMLAEYHALKAEQVDRIRTRDNLVYATLVTIGAVIFAALQNGRPELLLAIPGACAALGWTRLANDGKVDAIRGYLRDDLAPALAAVAGRPVLGWETATPTTRRRRWTSLLADLGVFVAPGAAAGVVALPTLWSALSFAAIPTLLLAFALPALLTWEIVTRRR